jgi:cysteine-rich repeat protein
VTSTPPEAGNGSSVGRFLCYKVKCPKGAPAALTIRDQFGARSVQPVVSKVPCAPELPSPVCGDGVTDDGEVCDDGNTTTETSCAYGTPTCTGCDANCNTIALVGASCGDGSINGPEACDDNNTNACGTCNETCTTFRLSAATGSIVAVDSA